MYAINSVDTLVFWRIPILTNENLNIDSSKIINIQTKQPSETRYDVYSFESKPIRVKSNINNKPVSQKILEGYKKLQKKYPSSQPSSAIIESGKQQEKSIMPQETYTKSEIDLKFDKISTDIHHGFEKVDLKFENIQQRMDDGFKQVDFKFENIQQRMDDGFKQVDLKFDNFERRIENMLLAQENRRLEEQAKNKKEFMYWAIGIIVALAGIAFPIWFGK